MSFEKILIALIPIPLFYLIYFRYFSFRPVYSKHIEAFLSGIAFALFLLLADSFLLSQIKFEGVFATGFVKAAMIEKVGVFLFLLFTLRHYPNFSAMEAIMSAMMFGLGFSVVENILYSEKFGESLVLLRILFSVPLHITTCGIMGYFMGLSRMCATFSFKAGSMIRALTYGIILHGIFDTILISGGYVSYFASPMLILLVFVLELLLAKTITILPHQILLAMNLRFEDWLIIERQQRYERWIMQSMGKPDLHPPVLFLWKPGIVRFFFMVVFMIAAVVGVSFKTEILAFLNLVLKPEDEIVLLGAFPLSMSLVMILVGAVNPEFFRKSKIKIPVISDVDVVFNEKENDILITYDITSVNCFINSSQYSTANKNISLKFSFSKFTSPEVKGEIVWENQGNYQESIGSVVNFKNPGYRFYLFLARYYFFRIWKGIVFTFKLPGFETTRKLFVRPVSTMQDIKVMSAGTVVYHEGEVGKEFYLLKKGSVIFYKKKDLDQIITVDVVEEGHIFGELSIKADNKRQTSAICATDCVIAVASRDNLSALIDNNPDFARSLIFTLVNRVQMSEGVYAEQIKEQIKQKNEKSDMFKAGLFLILSGLGYKPKKNKLSVKVNYKNIFESIDKKNLSACAEIIKEAISDASNPDLDPLVKTTAQDIIKKYSVEIK